MAFSIIDFETMNSELSLVFDSCSCKEKKDRIKLQELIDKLSEIYGKDVITVFKESLIQTQGISTLNKSVTKDEFFAITKNVVYLGSQTNNEISMPDRSAGIVDVKSSTPISANHFSPRIVLKDESSEIQQISPISKCNCWKNNGNQILGIINESLEKKLTLAESTIQRLEEKLKNEKAINLKLTKDFDSLREEAKRLWNSEEQFVEATGTLQALEVKYRAIKEELVKTMDNVELLETQNTHLQHENAALDHDLKKQVQKCNKLEEYNQSLANEIISLKTNAHQLQNEICDMKSKEKDFNNRIEQLKNEKQELRLQLMDTDKLVTNEVMWPAYCMNVSKESTSPAACFIQSTPENNNNNSLMSELTSLSENYSFFGTLIDRNSTDSKKDLIEKFTQTDMVKYSDVGILTCPSETLQEKKHFSDKFAQTYIEVSDIGIYALIPAPSEQLTSTRGVQVDFNPLTLSTWSRNHYLGRTSSSRRSKITHTSVDKETITYETRSRFKYCVVLWCIIIVAAIFLTASVVPYRYCVLNNRCSSCWNHLSTFITFSYPTGPPPV